MSEDAYRAFLKERQTKGDASNLTFIHHARTNTGRGTV